MDRISCVHQLRDRDVFYSSKGRRNFDMHRLSVRLQLDCGERSFDELHLQRRMDDPNPNRHSLSDVHWRLSVPAVNRHSFWHNLRRYVRLCNQCKLSVAHRFQWFDQSLVLVIQYRIALRHFHRKSVHILLLRDNKTGCEAVRQLCESEHYLYVKYRIHAGGVYF